MVVSSRLREATRSGPILSRAKHPVPYVDFIMPGLKQPCPIVAACWSPAMPRMRNRRRRTAPRPSCRILRRSRDTSGSSDGGTPNRRQSSSSHCPLADIEQQRARGIGGVGRVHLAAGEPPQQKRVDGAEGELARVRRGPRAGNMYRAARRSWWRRNTDRAAARSCSAIAGSWPALRRVAQSLRGAPVLPDDGVVDRLAAGAVPDDRGLALIGDADAGDVFGRKPGLRHRRAHGGDGRRPDVLWVVLDQARRRIDLPQFLLRRRRAA